MTAGQPRVAPPQSDPVELGARLRELRTASGFSVSEVARRLDISTSAMSQIERGALRPSVARLIAICEVLGVPLADVFDEGDPTGAETEHPSGHLLSRAGAAVPVVLADGVIFRRLSPSHSADVDFFESTYPPGATASEARHLVSHEGYEVGTVTAGELTIQFESETVTLAAGDSISYPCAHPHLISNEGLDTAVATWLIVH